MEKDKIIQILRGEINRHIALAQGSTEQKMKDDYLDVSIALSYAIEGVER